MRRLMGGIALAGALSVAAVAASGCGNQTPPTAPTATPTVPVTENFTGTLTVNGGQTFPFQALASGAVTATLKTFAPETDLKVGLLIGVFNGVSCSSIQGVGTNDSATQGVTLTAYVSTAAALCVRVYDSTGLLTQVNSFEVTVIHP
jgi:hypothetical protein